MGWWWLCRVGALFRAFGNFHFVPVTRHSGQGFGNDGHLTLVYNSGRSSLGMHKAALLRRVTYHWSGQDGLPRWSVGTREFRVFAVNKAGDGPVSNGVVVAL